MGSRSVLAASQHNHHGDPYGRPRLAWRRNAREAKEIGNTLIDGECEIESTVSNGRNIESPGDTCGFEQGTDLVNITEGQLDLGPLQDNDGPTMTHALGADSVAIDHIPAVDCEVDEDQRGEPRPETGGTMCDVGSFERQPEDP